MITISSSLHNIIRNHDPGFNVGTFCIGNRTTQHTNKQRGHLAEYIDWLVLYETNNYVLSEHNNDNLN